MRVWIAAIALIFGFPQIAQAARYQCPSEVEPLVNRLVKDLPSYANREIVRSRRSIPIAQLGSVVLAGRPEFEPLPTRSRPDPTLKQAFITTLEREFVSGKRVELQQFHWLFLTRAETGWQLALMFTRTGSYPSTPSTTPPRESSQGAIAQGIQRWLRDCNAGFIRP